jgi:hypothetical protein
MPAIVLNPAPTEDQIQTLPDGKRVIWQGGRWKLFQTNMPLTGDSAFALNPFASEDEPEVTIPERLWFKPSTSTLHYKYTTVGGTSWKPLRESDTFATVVDGVIDLAEADIHVLTVSGAVTLSTLNVKAAPQISSFILEISNGISAPVGWLPNTNWDGGVPPTLTAGVDIIGFYTRDGGASWRGFEMSNDSKLA